jgi:predicted DNA binding protein
VIQTYLQISSKDYYSCTITKRIPVKVTIVTILLPEGFGLVEALEGGENSIRAFVDSMKASDSIQEFEVTYASPTIYWTRTIHRLDFPSIYETVLETGNMSLLPITVYNGIQHHTVLSPNRDNLKILLKTLKSRFTAVKIVSLTSIPLKLQEDILTSKQLEAFRLAFRRGYYKIPRKAKLEELAQQIGIKRVAMQERLRRAELRILSEYAKKIP